MKSVQKHRQKFTDSPCKLLQTAMLLSHLPVQPLTAQSLLPSLINTHRIWHQKQRILMTVVAVSWCMYIYTSKDMHNKVCTFFPCDANNCGLHNFFRCTCMHMSSITHRALGFHQASIPQLCACTYTYEFQVYAMLRRRSKVRCIPISHISSQPNYVHNLMRDIGQQECTLNYSKGSSKKIINSHK